MPSVFRVRWRKTSLNPQDTEDPRLRLMREAKSQQTAMGIKSAKFRRKITLPNIKLKDIGDDNGQD